MPKGKYRSRQEWQALIEEQAVSGLSGLEFCRQRGLYAKTFYRQRKRLGYSQGQTRPSRPRGFVQVRPQASPPVNQSLVLHYRDSRLELSSGTNAQWVAELLRALV